MSFTLNTFEDWELAARIFDQVFPGFSEGGRKMKVIIDAFGGDNAPAAVLEGCALALRELPEPDLRLVLTGDEGKIRAAAAEQGIDMGRIEVVHAPDVIPVCEEPTHLLKKYKDCSMARGLQLLADGEGDAFITAGSTGAMVVGATFIVKRIKGVKRPAIGTVIPNSRGHYMLLDSGANDECRPEMLRQFGVMGSVYMEHIMQMENPRVGLLNIGTEDSKGTPLQVEANRLLGQTDLNYVGNVEARELPLGGCDVAVADGFTGNVALKMTEGMAKMILGGVKEIFMTNLTTKLAALMVAKQVQAYKKKMDASEIGGALLLGVRRPVIKAHGNSDGRAFRNAIRQAALCCRYGVVDRIAQRLEAIADGEEA